MLTNPNNNEKKNYSPTVYSRYSLNNPNGVDPSVVNFSMWSKTLKITFTPYKEVQKEGEYNLDKDNAGSANITHVKAKQLLDEIIEFEKDPDKYSNLGVISGSALLSISNGKELGVNSPCLILRMIDEEGNQTSSYAYEFSKDYHYVIRNYDKDTRKYEKVFDNGIELDMFKTLLRKYYEEQSGATAFAVLDNFKYSITFTNNKIDAIVDKLGIDYKSGKSNNNYKKSQTAFSKASDSEIVSYSKGTAKTLDDM